MEDTANFDTDSESNDEETLTTAGVDPIAFERCSKCKQMVPQGSRRVGAHNRHDCAALDADTKEWSLLYKCTRCLRHGKHVVFTGLSNVGQWECRYHPGKYIPEQGYSCCGRKRMFPNNPFVHNGVWSRRGQLAPLPFEPEGCTPCDHYHSDIPRATCAIQRPLDVQPIFPIACSPS